MIGKRQLRAGGRLSWAALLTAVWWSAATAQDLRIPPAVYPALPTRAATAEGFVPPGWKIELKASGDLNRDKLADLVLVLREDNTANVIEHSGLGETPFDTNPRVLAIAFRTDPAGGYALALENHTLIPRRDDPVLEDPLSETGGIIIDRGALRIRLHAFASAGGWDMSTVSLTFRYRDGRFELIGYDRSTTARNTGEIRDVSINYLTRKLKTTIGNIADDARRAAWKILRPRALLTVRQVGDGLAFDPEHRD